MSFYRFVVESIWNCYYVINYQNYTLDYQSSGCWKHLELWYTYQLYAAHLYWLLGVITESSETARWSIMLHLGRSSLGFSKSIMAPELQRCSNKLVYPISWGPAKHVWDSQRQSHERDQVWAASPLTVWVPPTVPDWSSARHVMPAPEPCTCQLLGLAGMPWWVRGSSEPLLQWGYHSQALSVSTSSALSSFLPFSPSKLPIRSLSS